MISERVIRAHYKVNIQYKTVRYCIPIYIVGLLAIFFFVSRKLKHTCSGQKAANAKRRVFIANEKYDNQTVAVLYVSPCIY